MARPYSATGAILFLVFGATVVAGDGPTLAPPPRSVALDDLIRRLGSEDFLERQAAMRRLSALPVDAPPPALIEATRSPDPEVRRRAGEAVKAIRTKAEDRALGRERLFAKRGAIDLFVASTSAWDIPADDDRLWQAVLDVGMALVRKLPALPKLTPIDSGKAGGWSPQNGRVPITPARFWSTSGGSHLLIRSNEPYRVPSLYRYGGFRATEVIAPEVLTRNLVVADGQVRAGNYISESIILANGNVTTARYLSNAIVVCDGDVEVAETLSRAVVIARGDITVQEHASSSTLIAGGKVSIAKEGPPNLRNVVEEKQSKPLDFVTFFELSTVGVEAKAVDKAVQITAVAVGKPFAHAGVCVGDIILEVNGKKPDSAESLRRLLRDALAIGDATVKLNRGGKTETVKVSLPE
jgi:type II secretory pathway component PulC